MFEKKRLLNNRSGILGENPFDQMGLCSICGVTGLDKWTGEFTVGKYIDIVSRLQPEVEKETIDFIE